VLIASLKLAGEARDTRGPLRACARKIRGNGRHGVAIVSRVPGCAGRTSLMLVDVGRNSRRKAFAGRLLRIPIIKLKSMGNPQEAEGRDGESPLGMGNRP
jgi:hypothetical protein